MICVEEIMTQDLITLKPENTVLDARQIINTKGIRHIPIVNEKGALVGLFSQRDLLAVMDSTEADLSKAERKENEAALLMRDVMTQRVSTARKNVSLREAALFLQNNKYGCLPIVEQGELLGIITDTDFIEVAINLLEQVEITEEIETDDVILESVLV